MSAVVPPTPLDRLWAAFRALVRAELPSLTFLGVYEYAVDAADGTTSTPSTTVDCTPTDSTISLPPLTAVPIRLPFGVTPPVGALCYVEFANGDPTKPIVRGFKDPMSLMVFAGGSLPASRQGDMVQLIPLGMTVSLGPVGVSLPATTGTPYPLFFIPPPPAAPVPVPYLYGMITTGNPQVKE
jgi:hypothetical protein